MSVGRRARKEQLRDDALNEAVDSVLKEYFKEYDYPLSEAEWQEIRRRIAIRGEQG